MTVELERLASKVAHLQDVQRRAGVSQRRWMRTERDATEAVENLVGFLLDNKVEKSTSIARTLNTSRWRVQGMADRARTRNRELLDKSCS